MHGNLISSFSDCTKLKGLKELRKLTLHGCPVSEKHNYKMQICANLPQVSQVRVGVIKMLPVRCVIASPFENEGLNKGRMAQAASS